VREGAVGFRHPVRVFALLDRGATTMGRVQHLGSQTFLHRVFRAGACSDDQPADRQRLTALGTDFDRNLIRGAADAARAHFNRRRDVAEGFMEQLGRRALGLGRNGFERAVNDLFGGRFFCPGT